MLIDLDEKTVEKAITACRAQFVAFDNEQVSKKDIAEPYYDAYWQLSQRYRVWSPSRGRTSEIQSLEHEKWLIERKLKEVEEKLRKTKEEAGCLP